MTTPTADVEVTTDLTRIDLDRVHRWLSQDAPWATGRSRRTVELAARNSLNFGLLDTDGRLRAYARVGTDYATFAWLCDVYVDPAARGNGLGRQLTDAVVETLRPMHLKRVLLATDGAHGLYRRVGFTQLPEPDNWMILAGSRS
jgi:GNAT superfamily N-acetyltransferase